VFLPRYAVLVDRDGREVRVVPFTRNLDKIALHHDAASTSERVEGDVSSRFRSKRIFLMTNEVDDLGRPILRERAE
jgi:hypothetical protein